MIIYTGRFQPFHNGHLSLIKRIRANYPEQKLCIAVIKDVPIDVKSEFDRTADGVLSKKGNPFNSEIVLTLIEKVLKSAVANAENNFDLDRASLVVSEAFANEGPTLKRFRPRAKGSASPINKRTSHITVVVTER